MKSIDQSILRVFLFGLPVVIVFALFLTTFDRSQLQGEGIIGALNSLGGFVIGSWMTLSLYFSLRLLFSPEFRADVLPKLTFFRERDERELLIAAKATRNTFLATLALLLFMFCLSAFQVAVYRVPAEQAVAGKTGMLSLGVNVNLTNKNSNIPTGVTDYFRYDGLPISNSAIVLFLIVWLLVSYNYFVRQLNQQSELLEA